MAATVIGRVKSGKGKSYEVKRGQSSRDVYVSWGGWSHVLERHPQQTKL